MNGSERLFASVFENAPTGLALLDSQNRVAYANNRFVGLFVVHGEQKNAADIPLPCRQQDSSSHSECGSCDACSRCKFRSILSEIGNINGSGEYEMHFNDGTDLKWVHIGFNHNGETGNTILSATDITPQKLYEKHLRKRLSIDQATGAANKTSLMAVLRELARSSSESACIAFVDFDNFKLINDRHGHIVGDKVLSAFCYTAMSKIRANDIVARFGGEEFVLVFPGVKEEQAVEVIKRIRNSFIATCASELEVPVTFSTGVLEISPADFASSCVETLINAADERLYKAKNMGKNLICGGNGIMKFDD